MRLLKGGERSSMMVAVFWVVIISLNMLMANATSRKLPTTEFESKDHGMNENETPKQMEDQRLIGKISGAKPTRIPPGACYSHPNLSGYTPTPTIPCH